MAQPESHTKLAVGGGALRSFSARAYVAARRRFNRARAIRDDTRPAAFAPSSCESRAAPLERLMFCTLPDVSFQSDMIWAGAGAGD